MVALLTARSRGFGGRLRTQEEQLGRTEGRDVGQGGDDKGEMNGWIWGSLAG